MSSVIPLVNEKTDLVAQILDGLKVGDRETFTLQNAEPLLDLIHPGAVDGCEMKSEAGMAVQPSHDFFSFVDAQVVANDEDPGDVIRDSLVEIVQEGDTFCLAFASETTPIHSACPGIKSGKEIERALADVFVLQERWFPGFSRFSGVFSGTGLQRCLFIQREYHFVGE